ncbi:hypothetical protein QWZ13_19035 [Reinekea marina]|uniref:hypothetical protein n=1 Tax=Reinekea marina TaxID=1310421 RepID=UPI0025B2F6CB|nr:hypothetical protein [Reinekea marina]MDN3651009.1 hypothetical protein [Reinekea marina]
MIIWGDFYLLKWLHIGWILRIFIVFMTIIGFFKINEARSSFYLSFSVKGRFGGKSTYLGRSSTSVCR